MIERELVVGTLAEMDPVDDRLAAKKKAQNPNSCLLGYNTNAGTRIDLKLRPDNLDGFYPYRELAATLLHELSHNWVGEHNALFWSNYGQMRVEYLVTHARLAAGGYVIDGRTSAAVAGLEFTGEELAGGGRGSIRAIYERVVRDLTGECAEHGVSMDMVAPAVYHRCNEMEEKEGRDIGGGGRMVGGRGDDRTNNGSGASPRDRALAAAEKRRARDQREQEKYEE